MVIGHSLLLHPDHRGRKGGMSVYHRFYHYYTPYKYIVKLIGILYARHCLY